MKTATVVILYLLGAYQWKETLLLTQQLHFEMRVTERQLGIKEPRAALRSSKDK